MPIYTTDDEKKYLKEIGENKMGAKLPLKPIEKVELLQKYIEINTEKRKKWDKISPESIFDFARKLISIYGSKIK